MTDIDYLNQAIELSRQSPEEVGCGVLIVSGGQIIAAEYNSQKTDKIAVNHAELKAVTAANIALKSRTLQGAVAYCSCEPCVMCLVALSYAKVERIVFRQRMIDLFPDDPQSRLSAVEFVSSLNFVPKLQQLVV